MKYLCKACCALILALALSACDVKQYWREAFGWQPSTTKPAEKSTPAPALGGFNEPSRIGATTTPGNTMSSAPRSVYGDPATLKNTISSLPNDRAYGSPPSLQYGQALVPQGDPAALQDDETF